MMSAPVRQKTGCLQGALLSVGSVTLLLLAIEVVLRIAGYGRLEVYQPDPKLFWRLKPNQDCLTKVGRKPVRVNAHGTRGPEFNESKPPGTIRILSLGDSRTFGWGLAEAETYSAMLGQILQSRLGDAAQIEIINAGVNAWSFAQMKIYFQEYGLRYQPDIAILAEANLWTQFSERSRPEFARAFMNRVRFKNLLRRSALYHWLIEVQLKAFYERHRTKFIPVDPEHDPLFKKEQQADPDARFKDDMAAFCRLASSSHVKPVLLYLPTADELDGTNPPRTLRLKEAVSQESGVPLVNVTPALRSATGPLYLDADPVHLNSRANGLVAQELAEAIAPLVNP